VANDLARVAVAAQEIDGNRGWGTYKNDGKRYADFLAASSTFGARVKASDIGLSFHHNQSGETTLPD
jgi:hypothetical protein